jgi:hypothetical protein
MGINFPSSPLIGDLWPNPAVAGQGQYTWDGEKWTSGTVNTVGAVRYDTPQTLTTDSGTTKGQRSQARSNVYAAPFDALAYSGMQINGACDISQESGAANVSLINNAAVHMCDGWQLVFAHASAAFQGAAGSLSAFGAPLSGYRNGLVMTATSPMTALVNGNVAYYRVPIEGYRLSRLGFGTATAQSFSFGFWIFTPVAGGVNIRVGNAGAIRYYLLEKTVVTGWNWVTGTVPGDVTGTWDTSNGVGLRFDVGVSGFASAAAPVNTWNTNTGLWTPNLTNQFAANTTTIVTGLVIIAGNEVPSAARAALMQRPASEELQLCKRYLEIVDGYVAGHSTGVFSSSVALYSKFEVEKRATPTATITSSALVATTFTSATGTPRGVRYIYNTTATGTYVVDVVTKADARLS